MVSRLLQDDEHSRAVLDDNFINDSDNAAGGATRTSSWGLPERDDQADSLLESASPLCGDDVDDDGGEANGPIGPGDDAAAGSNRKDSKFPFRSSSSSRRKLPSTSRLMKRLARWVLWSSSAIFIFIIFPLLLKSAVDDQRRGRTDFAAFYSAASFVVLTVVLSLREIVKHLLNWYAPDVQKFVVRILFMVPLYSVQSWLSLRFHGAPRIYIDTVRDLYEAFVIQSFVYFLIELLGGEDRMVDLLKDKDPALGSHGEIMRHVLGRPWEMGEEFLLQIKHGVLQYVLVKTILTLLTTFVFLPSGLYGEGTFSWSTAYGYVSFVLNISVVYALYCLVKLFHATQDDLRHPVDWHPVGKFLCVKGVVFATWWQSVVIYFLRGHGYIDDVGSWSGDDVANGIIDYLVCIEMVFFAVAHMYTFTYKEYLPEETEGDGGAEGDASSPPSRIASLLSGISRMLLLGLETESTNDRRGNRPRSTNDRGQPRHGTGERARAGDGTDTIEFEGGGLPSINESGGAKLGGFAFDGSREDGAAMQGGVGDGDDDGVYRPPSTPTNMSETSPSGPATSHRKLDEPMSLRAALWSSTVPLETIDDIKRLNLARVRGGMGRGVGSGSLAAAGRGAGGTSSELGSISMGNIKSGGTKDEEDV